MSLFSETLGITPQDFLSRTQVFVVPELVIIHNRDLLEAIARLLDTSAGELCASNIACILARLFLNISNDNLEEVMSTLKRVAPEFEKIDLDSLIKSEAVPLVVEILKAFHHSSPKEIEKVCYINFVLLCYFFF